jgi:DNA-binding LytR/AlgR family response regulator
VASPKILIVEDDPLVLTVSAETIRDAGLDVIEAETADMALVLFQEHDNDIAVVFSDIETPGRLNGVALAAVIQEHRPGLPVVLTSGRGFAPPAPLPSATLFIAKPYRLGEVAALIVTLANPQST